jgi:hypothetical protein
MYSMFILRSSFFFFSAKRLIIAHNFSLVVTVPCLCGRRKPLRIFTLIEVVTVAIRTRDVPVNP